MSEPTTTYERLAAEFAETFTDRRGGVDLTYITGEQCLSRLNDVLGVGGWSFDVREHGINQDADEVWVLGRLVATIDGERISREQFGSQKLKRSRETKTILDIGFDLKGAATDALKKTAMGIGVGLYLSHKEAKANAARPQQAPVAQSAPRAAAPLQHAPAAPPVVAPEASSGNPICNCGERVYKTGTGRQNGKPWAAWMCASNPGICPPQWVDLDEAKFIQNDLEDRADFERRNAQAMRELDSIPF